MQSLHIRNLLRYLLIRDVEENNMSFRGICVMNPT